MGNRSKLVAVSAGSASAVALGVLVRGRRHARLAHATKEFAEAIMPTEPGGTPSVTMTPVVDEAHAPGHRHLRWARAIGDGPEPAPARQRPFAKHRHGLRHPGRG